MKLSPWYIVFMLFMIGCACDIVEQKPKKIIKATGNAVVEKEPMIRIDSIGSNLDTVTKENETFDTTVVTVNELVNEFSFVDHFETKSGLIIDWIKKNRGRSLNKGELLMIEYRLSLPNGKIIDGNNRMDLPYLPFVLGFNMQNKGWDEALALMRVGDIAQVKIPANLAYGEKGLGELIPPNTENWLFVKIHGIVSPTSDLDGIKIWELNSGKSSGLKEMSKVKFHMIVSSESRANILNTYTSNFPVTYTPGQKNYPIGLRKVLNNAKIGQQIFVVLNSEMASIESGDLGVSNSKESVFYNLKILEIE
tara:strand:- start:100 stop:1023 length:924 start_codon:yes stop_codon:yes gene_type:complete